MYYQNRFDSHVHSDCSPGGHDTVICLAEKAVRRDLTGIAITDCCDVNLYREMQVGQRIKESVYSVYKARAAFENKLIIASGIELSQPMSNPEFAEKIAAAHPFDVVLCSVKAFPDGDALRGMDFGKFTEGELLDRLAGYYSYMLDTVRWGKFDVLAYLTYPMRCIYRSGRPDFSYHLLDDLVEEVLRALAEGGKALEISTAELRGELGLVLPQSRYIRRFRELGGQYVTIGSGAHGVGTVGSDISDGMLAAAEAGFEQFAFYKQRQPKLLTII